MIEEIEFGDGTEWSYAKLLQHVIDLAKTAGDDTVYGFSTDDSLDGGAGNDRLEGQGGNDAYVFVRGQGSDTVFDAGGQDRITLSGISVLDVTFSRTALDLVIAVNETGERLVLEGQYVRDGQQRSAMEVLEFADRTILFTDLNPEDIDLIGTNGADNLTGSDFAEIIDGRAGNDTLTGGDGGDRYRFDVGYGSDVIIDRRKAASWADRPGITVPVNDVVEFGDDITRANVIFTKDGDDLVISVLGRSDTLRIRDQFRGTTNGVERFEFADGGFLTLSDVTALLQIEGGNRGDNLITGLVDQPNVLDGREGDDTLVGGRAADTYAFGVAYDFDTIREQADVAGVIDRVIFGEAVTADRLLVLRDGADLLIDLGNGTDVLRVVGGLTTSKVEEFHFADGSVLTIEQLRDRILTGSSRDERLVGFDGRADTLSGEGGSDALEGGTGNDVYRFGFGSGRDSILETGGIDRLEFGQGVTIAALEFADVDGNLLITLKSTGENIVVLGGASLTSTAGQVESFFFADGTSLSLSDVRDILVSQSGNGGQDQIAGTALPADYDIEPGRGFDSVTMGPNSRYVFNAGDGLDQVNVPATATSGEIVFADLASTQAIIRGDVNGGNVTIAFPESGDQVTLFGILARSSGPVVKFVDGVELTLVQLRQRAVEGQAGESSDVIFGTNFADTLSGRSGDDVLLGGVGNDRYVFQRGDGRDVIQDNSSSSADRLDIFGYAPAEMKVTRVDPSRLDLVLSFAGTNDEITLLYGSGTTGIDSVVFGDGSTFTRDQLFASTVGQGTRFDDLILGVSAADTLTGGAGDDTLMGGGGVDTYVFRRGDGSDLIDESGTWTDLNRLHLMDHTAAEASAILLPGSSVDVVLRLGGGDEVLLEDAFSTNARVQRIEFSDGTVWTQTELQAAVNASLVQNGVRTINGTYLNETLDGTRADEVIDGKGGRDTYIFTRGDGHDVLTNWNYEQTLVLRGYVASDLRVTQSVERAGMLLRFDGTSDEVLLRQDVFSTFVFDDRTLTLRDVAQRLVAADVAPNFYPA